MQGAKVIPRQPRAAVIGCGNIGSLWDETHHNDAILTHAGAWWRLGMLCGCADPNPGRRLAVTQRWPDVAVYADYHDLLATLRPDIVSIATPTELRLPVIMAALAAGVRALLIEKPLAPTLSEAQAIIEMIRSAGASAAVNYLRRYEPQFLQVATEITAGRLGIIQHACGHYGKGIRENGSHLLDLIHWWLGKIRTAQVLRHIADDRSGADPTLDLLLTVERHDGTIPVYLTAVDQRNYALFELDILGSTGRIILSNRGMSLQIWEAIPDPLFPGYRVLQLAEEKRPDLTHALLHAATDLVAVWRGERPEPRCTLDDGFAVLATIAEIN